MRRIRASLALVVALVLAFTGLATVPATAATPDDDVNTIVSRLQEYYLAQGDEIIIANGIYLARVSEAQEYAASQYVRARSTAVTRAGSSKPLASASRYA